MAGEVAAVQAEGSRITLLSSRALVAVVAVVDRLHSGKQMTFLGSSLGEGIPLQTSLMMMTLDFR